jgi:hypothetical protein
MHPVERWAQWLALAWLVAPYAWSLIDRERQFLHDRLAGTRIVLTPIGSQD